MTIIRYNRDAYLERRAVLAKINGLMVEFPSDGLRVLKAWIIARGKRKRINEQKVLDEAHLKIKKVSYYSKV